MWELYQHYLVILKLNYDNRCHITILINGIIHPKVKSFWTKEERKKHPLASKVKWITTNSLTPNESEIISNSTIAKQV